MDYKDWVRDELEGLSKSMGFRYVPRKELEERLKRLRAGMEERGIDAFLVVQKMDYYFSGTAQDGMLFVPLDGKPILMVKRELERAGVESGLDEIVGIRSVRELPSLIREHSGGLPLQVLMSLE